MTRARAGEGRRLLPSSERRIVMSSEMVQVRKTARFGVEARLTEETAALLAKVVEKRATLSGVDTFEKWILFHLERDRQALGIEAATRALARTRAERVIEIAKLAKDARRRGENVIQRVSWDAWCRQNLPVTGSFALALIDIVDTFTSIEIESIGVSKLMVLLRIPDAEHRKSLVPYAKEWTLRELRRRVGGIVPARRITGRKKTPEGGGRKYA